MTDGYKDSDDGESDAQGDCGIQTTPVTGRARTGFLGGASPDQGANPTDQGPAQKNVQDQNGSTVFVLAQHGNTGWDEIEAAGLRTGMSFGAFKCILGRSRCMSSGRIARRGNIPLLVRSCKRFPLRISGSILGQRTVPCKELDAFLLHVRKRSRIPLTTAAISVRSRSLG